MSTGGLTMILSERFEQALIYAHHLHKHQRRKATQIPYISHLLSVAALVLENNGDEDEAIAALLHDAPEDQGGMDTLEEIRVRFGERVAAIVAGCTDTYSMPKPPWTKRKQEYLAHLRTADPSTRKVSLADKLHNARALLASYRCCGEDTWSAFNGGRAGTLWYYHSLVEIFLATGDDPMTHELRRVVAELEVLVHQTA